MALVLELTEEDLKAEQEAEEWLAQLSAQLASFGEADANPDEIEVCGHGGLTAIEAADLIRYARRCSIELIPHWIKPLTVERKPSKGSAPRRRFR